MSALFPALTAVFGAALGVATTYFVNRSTMRLNLEHEYDRTLRDKRLAAHQALFHLTRQIPRHWLLIPVPMRSDLLPVRASFRNWYFAEEAHGMFLSQGSKRAYLALEDALDNVLFVRSPDGHSKTADRADTPLTPGELDDLQRLASELRHQLVADIGGSNPPRTRSTRPDPTLRGMPDPF